MTETVNDAFGTCFREEEIKQVQIKGLPLSVTSLRSFYKISDEDDSFLLIRTSVSEKFSVSALSKQKILYEEKTNMPAAFFFSELTKPQRDSLISHRIPFIFNKSQIYLPFLAISLKNRFSSPKEVKSEKMMPVTQSLFLYLMYECSGKKVMKKQAAEFLKTTCTSITRASAQLNAMKLILQEKQGKEFYMWTDLSGDELIQKALPYMINPVQEKITAAYSDKFSGLTLSGESALSGENRRLPHGIRCYAIDKDLYREYEKNRISYSDESGRDTEEIELELWKYDPKLFAKNGIVDPISLYLSVRGMPGSNIKLQWRN